MSIEEHGHTVEVKLTLPLAVAVALYEQLGEALPDAAACIEYAAEVAEAMNESDVEHASMMMADPAADEDPCGCIPRHRPLPTYREGVTHELASDGWRPIQGDDAQSRGYSGDG